MYRSGLVDTLVTHANMKGLGLTPLFGDRRGFMPPQLKTNKTKSPSSSVIYKAFWFCKIFFIFFRCTRKTCFNFFLLLKVSQFINRALFSFWFMKFEKKTFIVFPNYMKRNKNNMGNFGAWVARRFPIYD